MDGYFDVGFRKPRGVGCFLHALLFELHHANGGALFFGEFVEKGVDVALGVAGFVVGVDFADLDAVERRVRAMLGAAQEIDQAIAGNRIEPSRERIGGVVAVAARMQCDECLLHEILRIFGAPAQTIAEIGAQQPRRFRQKDAVRGFVAGEALEQQGPKMGFVGHSPRLVSYARAGTVVTPAGKDRRDTCRGW